MPRKATPFEVERLKTLRTALSAEDGLKTTDTFAKYLVTSAATVGTLGAGLSVAGLPELAGVGETLFVIAVACVGVSLALAVWALTPTNVTYNPNQISSMESGLDQLLTRRRRILASAALFFALAFVLAGISPIASSAHEGETATGLSYAVADDAKITATAAVAEGDELSPLTLRISPIPGAKTRPRVSGRTLLDQDGVGSVSAELAAPRSVRKVQLRALWEDPDGKDQVEKATVFVRHKAGRKLKE